MHIKDDCIYEITEHINSNQTDYMFFTRNSIRDRDQFGYRVNHEKRPIFIFQDLHWIDDGCYFNNLKDILVWGFNNNINLDFVPFYSILKGQVQKYQNDELRFAVYLDNMLDAERAFLLLSFDGLAL